MSTTFQTSTGLSGMMNFDKALSGMSSAVTAANSALVSAQSAMKAGDPASIIEVQIQMQSFTQVLTTMTNMLKGLNDVTSTANRNIN